MFKSVNMIYAQTPDVGPETTVTFGTDHFRGGIGIGTTRCSKNGVSLITLARKAEI